MDPHSALEDIVRQYRTEVDSAFTMHDDWAITKHVSFAATPEAVSTARTFMTRWQRLFTMCAVNIRPFDRDDVPQSISLWAHAAYQVKLQLSARLDSLG